MTPEVTTDQNRSAPSRRNELKTINNLFPTEIIGEIFLWVVREHRSVYTDSFGWPSDVDPHGWLGITHVCRRWRYIAVNLNELWTLFVIAPGNKARLEEFIRRSNQSPLTIQHHRTHHEHIPEALLAQMYRIRVLHLSLHTPCVWVKLQHALSHAPLLEELYLKRLGPSVAAVDEITSTPFVPNLKRLRFWDATPEMVETFRVAGSHLTSLEFGGYGRWITSLTEILRIFPLLEELHISLPGGVRVPDVEHRVPLTHLRSLILREAGGNQQPFANLLRQLFMPSTVKFILYGCGYNGFVDHLGHVYGAVTSTISDSTLAAAQHPLACYIEAGRVNISRLRLWSKELSANQLRSVSALANSQLDFAWFDHRTHVLLTFPTHLPLHHLRTICVDGLPGSMDNWWLLDGAENLREIEVSRTYEALLLLVDLQSHGPPKSAGSSTVLFPRLESITLRAVEWNMHAHYTNLSVAPIRELLKFRREHGAPLKRVYIAKAVDVCRRQMEELRDSEEGLGVISWDPEQEFRCVDSCDAFSSEADGHGSS